MGEKYKSFGMLGKHHSEETKKKLSESSKKNIPYWLGKKRPYKKRSGWSKEARIRLSLTRPKGDKSHLWKGGVAEKNLAIRNSSEYKLWRSAIFSRDNYTCILCGKKGGWSKTEKKKIDIQADHIKSFSQFPELRFAIDNGRTLCKECHKKTPNYGRPKKNKSGVDQS